MASSGLRRGFDLKLYRNTGSYGSPTWAVMNNCRDLDLGRKRTRIDSSTRGSQISTEVPGMVKIEPKWEMIYDMSDAALAAIFTAFESSTVAANQMEFAFSDGDITGSNIRYLRAICAVFTADEKQGLDGIDLVSVEVGPTYNSSGAPSVATA